MATSVYQPTAREKRVAKAIRERAVTEIKKRDLAAVAKALDLMPVGVERLLWETEWSLETAFRVADGLKIDIAEAIERTARSNGTARRR